MNKKAFLKYLCALLLFGSNGIVASHISLTSYEIVFLRTLIGCLLLLAIFLLTGNRFRVREHRRDVVYICLSGVAMGASTGLENTVLQLAAGFLTVAVFVGLKQHFVIHVPAADRRWILLLGLFNTGFGCYLYFSPLAELPVQTVAVCGYLEPLSAVVFAVLLLGEQMTLLQVIGAVCILGGAIVGEPVKGKQT